MSAYAEGQPTATFARPSSPAAAAPSQESSPVVTGEVFEPGEVLAIVGDQYILAADVLPHVNQVLEPYVGKATEQQLKEQKRILTAQLTAAHIEAKILYLAFLRKAPADKVKDVVKKVDADFDKKLEEERRNIDKTEKDKYGDLLRKEAQIGRLVILMKEKNIWTPGELDTLLRTYGGTLAQEKRFYAEYTLGRAMVGQGLNFNPTVSYDEMLRFYQEHEKDYLIPTRVRFEIMSARFANFPNKQKANEAICAMGNEVFYGASFAAVAKRSSQGLNAEQGGYHDWTNRGALASKAVDEALFSLEPGKLSQVIEDERGYHIVRVLERQEAGKVPFEEVQSTIRDKVKQEKMSKQYREVAVKFRQGVTVWTAFDEDPQLGKLFRRDTKTR